MASSRKWIFQSREMDSESFWRWKNQCSGRTSKHAEKGSGSVNLVSCSNRSGSWIKCFGTDDRRKYHCRYLETNKRDRDCRQRLGCRYGQSVYRLVRIQTAEIIAWTNGYHALCGPLPSRHYHTRTDAVRHLCGFWQRRGPVYQQVQLSWFAIYRD